MSSLICKCLSGYDLKTSSMTSASLLRVSSGRPLKVGTLWRERETFILSLSHIHWIIPQDLYVCMVALSILYLLACGDLACVGSGVISIKQAPAIFSLTLWACFQIASIMFAVLRPLWHFFWYLIGCLEASPLEEVHILGVFDEPGSHHDGLEALTVDSPQFHMDQCWNEQITALLFVS